MPADTGLQQQQVLEDAEVAGKAPCMNSEHLIEAGPQTAPFFATPMWGLGLPERITNRMARNAPPNVWLETLHQNVWLETHNQNVWLETLHQNVWLETHHQNASPFYL
jgi:hypothetical protein